MHISLPAGTPPWAAGIVLGAAVLIGLGYCIACLVRAALPASSVERLNWWMHYWELDALRGGTGGRVGTSCTIDATPGARGVHSGT